jgi:hypothetical protein
MHDDLSNGCPKPEGEDDGAAEPHLWFVPWGRVLHVFVPLGK